MRGGQPPCPWGTGARGAGKLHPCQKASEENDLDSFTDSKAPLRPNALLLQGITDVRVRRASQGLGHREEVIAPTLRDKAELKEQPLGVMSLREEGRGE